MKFTDIIELAKKGYSPKDIRELLALNVEEPAQETTEVPSVSAKDEHIDVTSEERADSDEMSGTETDERAEEIKKLQDEIAKLQAINTRRERPAPTPTKTDKEVLEDMARRFM